MPADEIDTGRARADGEAQQASPRNEMLTDLASRRVHRLPQDRLPVRRPERGDGGVVSQFPLDRRRCLHGTRRSE